MPCRMPALVLTLLTASLLTGCLTPEQRMIVKVEHFMAADRYDDALGYLDTYLGKHHKSLAGWRYRVLIRLDQEDRALAAGEYAALNEALERHEPDVLREVVLGAGGRWLLSDYRALARCAPAGVVDAAFFADLVEPKHLGQNSLTKVAISADEIGAVLDALPGALPAAETWAVVAKFEDDADPRIRGRVVRAAGRHLASGGLSAQATGQAIEILRSAALSSDAELREGALLATLVLPEGPGQEDFVGNLVTALAAAGDGPRTASLFLLGPGMRGPTAWTPEQLSGWAETTEGPLRVLAVSALHAAEPKSERARFLGEAAASQVPWRRLAAAAAFDHGAGGAAGEAWAGLTTEDKRVWGPAFVRTAAGDRGTWVKLILGESDAVTTQAAAAALALPGAGDDPDVNPSLEAALQVMDPATRASAARAVVVREAEGLALSVQGLFAQGQDRVMTDVLHGLVDSGNTAWQPLVDQGLKADLPMIRELAVDAAAASCRTDANDLMLGLLADEDPHVAVRAASALYLMVGSSEKKGK
jgi:hypothetical protein